MMQRRWPTIMSGMALTVLLGACSANPPVSAEQSAPADVLPTPRPRATVSAARPTVAIPVAPTDALRTAGATQVLTETTFTVGEPLANPSAWHVIDPDIPMQGHSAWPMSDGVLRQDGDEHGVPGMYGTALTTGVDSWTNYIVRAKVFVTTNDSAGLVARQSSTGYDIFRVLADGAVIEHYDAVTGKTTVLAQNEGPGFTANTWVSIAFVVKGTTLTGLVDGQTVIGATCATATHGRAGVWSLAEGGVQFDNFGVEASS